MISSPERFPHDAYHIFTPADLLNEGLHPVLHRFGASIIEEKEPLDYKDLHGTTVLKEGAGNGSKEKSERETGTDCG